MGIAGMTLGIIGLYLSLTLFGCVIAGPFICVGLPLSGIAFFQSRKSKKFLGIPIGIAIAGMATNILAIVVINVWTLLFVAWGVFGQDWIGPLMDIIGPLIDSMLSIWN